MHRQPLGYLFVDHRASPGLTPAQAGFCGYDAGVVGEGKLFEADMMVCAHCFPRRAVIKRPERIRPRGHCRQCNAFICDACVAEMTGPDYVHRPFLAKLEAAVKKDLTHG